MTGVMEKFYNTFGDIDGVMSNISDKHMHKIVGIFDGLKRWDGALSDVEMDTIRANLAAGHYGAAVQNLNRYVHEAWEEENEYADSLGTKKRVELEAKDATNQHRLAMIAQGNALRDTGRDTDKARLKVRTLSDALRDIPEARTTKVNADTAAARAKVDDYRAQLDSISARTWDLNMRAVVTGDLHLIKTLGFHANAGGWVPGSGNRDTVPAMLTPGEFVVTKDVARRYSPLLEGLNSGPLGRKRGGDGDLMSTAMPGGGTTYIDRSVTVNTGDVYADDLEDIILGTVAQAENDARPL
jgi:hypothetical protein